MANPEKIPSVDLVFTNEIRRKLFRTQTISTSTNFNNSYSVASTGSDNLLFQMEFG